MTNRLLSQNIICTVLSVPNADEISGQLPASVIDGQFIPVGICRKLYSFRFAYGSASGIQQSNMNDLPTENWPIQNAKKFVKIRF
jgi:hypothetical protein